jgi:RNA polymerase sigma factor (TIGR02999 family)
LAWDRLNAGDVDVVGDPGETKTGTITHLLADFENGDRTALEALFPIVYDELRSIAHWQRRKWDGDATLGTTALVHEAYLKLVDADHIGARSRAHFLRVASMAMRQILCNYARDRRTAKRGGDAPRISLDLLGEGAANAALSDEQSETLADLDEAMRRLEAVDSRLAAVVECRFFGGLSIEDTADALDISIATVKRDWRLARAWLYREMKNE